MTIKTNEMKSSGLTFFFLLLVIFAVAGYFAYQTLKVTQISIEGNNTFSKEKLIELAQIKPEDHLLNVNTDDIQLRLENNPYIVVEMVKRQWWPPMLKIKIRERQIDAVIRIVDEQICIDREGVVLDKAPEVPLKAQIEIKGLSISGYSIGKELAIYDIYQLETLKTVLRAVCEFDHEGFYTAIDITEPFNIRLETDSSIVVKIGQSEDVEKKIGLASTTLGILYEKGYEQGILDVSNANDAAYLENISDMALPLPGSDEPDVGIEPESEVNGRQPGGNPDGEVQIPEEDWSGN